MCRSPPVTLSTRFAGMVTLRFDAARGAELAHSLPGQLARRPAAQKAFISATGPALAP